MFLNFLKKLFGIKIDNKPQIRPVVSTSSKELDNIVTTEVMTPDKKLPKKIRKPRQPRKKKSVTE